MASCCHAHKVPWYKEKVIIASVVFAIYTAVAFHYIPTLFDSIAHYVHMMWWAILLGLVLGGIMDYFVPSEYITKILARKKKTTILSAIGLGFFMSACSHGILAIAIQLYKKGSSIASVIAFLLAAPWANLPMTLLFFSFFGWKALLIIGFSLFLAFTTGVIFQVLESKGIVEKNKAVPLKGDFSIRKDVKKRWAGYEVSFQQLNKDFEGVLRGSWSLAKMVLWWMIIGIMLSTIASTYVPTDFFKSYMGANVVGLIVTLVFATILEVCSEGASPLAFEIYRQTGAFGNAFVFLMAGVATDYTEIGLLWSNIGKKTAILLPLITVPQIVVFGVLLNVFL